ncbi:MAG: hypothetical protein MJD61_14400 [Proteobacteria bacterium]|nr:hypothetical protein [Pseudomonadota bacterium]
MRARTALLAGCLGACAHAAPAPDPLAGVDAARVASARHKAPDLVAMAEDQAARAVRAAGEDQGAARDHGSAARMLMSAAVMEAERIALEHRKQALLETEDRALETAARADRARRHLARQTKLLLAAGLARQQAQKAFAAAELGASQRDRSAERDTRRLAQATRFLLARSVLLIGAALGMNAGAESVQRARWALEIARSHQLGSSEAMAAARHTMLEAQRALGSARASRPGPRTAEIDSLLAAARQRGLQAEHLPRGVTLRLEHVFGRRAGRMRRRARPHLKHVVALLEAHPHGPVQVEVWRGAGRTALSPRAARSRAERLRARLAQSVSRPSRLRAQALDQGDARGAQIVFVAYGAGSDSAASLDAASTTSLVASTGCPGRAGPLR